MSKKLAHNLQIKKASFQVDALLQSLSEFKGTILKSSEISDFSILKDQHVALLGFNATLLSALHQALPYASFVKLFCENPAWVLKTNRPLFSLRSPIDSERINRLRHQGESQGYFTISTQDSAGQLAVKKAQSYLKKMNRDWLARQLTPHHLNAQHTFIFNDEFHTNVQNSRTKVITWPIVQVLEHGILSMEGIHHLVDVIITAD